MVIYIDIVFILNLLIHIITMFSTLIIMNTSLKTKNILISVFLLNLYTFSIYLDSNTLFLYLIMILIVISCHFKKKRIVTSLIFFIVHTTYIYSFVTFMNDCKVIHQVLIVPISFSWIYVFILCSIIIMIYIGHIYQLKQSLVVNQFIYPICIVYQSITYTINGFMDSGNQSMYNNNIVIYCLKSVFQEQYKVIDYMSVNMIKESQLIPIIKADYIVLDDKKYEDVYIGLVDTIDIEEVSCLLNIKLIYGG